MKCAEPYPKGSYEECQLDLGHYGKHQYVDRQWERAIPAELDAEVADLLDRSQPPRTWGVDERRYPVVVVETITRIIWVDAETEDEALAYWADDFADLELNSADVIDGDLDFQRPDEWQRQEASDRRRHGQKIGPQIQCPDCKRLAFRRAWYHDPYRRCHGPIGWRQSGIGKPMRDLRATPIHSNAGDPRG